MKQTRQEADAHQNLTTIASSATQGQVHSSQSKPSGRATEQDTSGRLSPPAGSLSSCCSTSTSKVFPGSSASHRVGTVGQGFCDVTSPNTYGPLREWVSGVHGCGWDSGDSSCGADTGGCGCEVCSCFSCPGSDGTIGWLSTVVSTCQPGFYHFSLANSPRFFAIIHILILLLFLMLLLLLIIILIILILFIFLLIITIPFYIHIEV